MTDPPYALVSVTKRFGKPGSAPAKFGTDGAYARASAGFMGKIVVFREAILDRHERAPSRGGTSPRTARRARKKGRA